VAVDFALQTWEHCGARSKNVRAGLGAEVGLATTILRATLRLAARRAISPALVVCDDMNLASIAVIERCGGALESVVSGSGCGPSQRRLGPDRKIEGRMATPKDRRSQRVSATPPVFAVIIRVEVAGGFVSDVGCGEG
jgi:hypothetical protein